MLWDKVRLLYQQLEIHICGMFQPLTTQFDFPEFLLGNKPQDHLFDVFPAFYGAIFKPVDKNPWFTAPENRHDCPPRFAVLYKWYSVVGKQIFIVIIIVWISVKKNAQYYFSRPILENTEDFANEFVNNLNTDTYCCF